jgi:hypothetical protein
VRRKTLNWRRVVDTTLVAAAGQAGSGSAELSQRLTRHFITLAVPAASEAVLRGICSAVLGGFLSAHFTPDVHSRMLRPLVEGCVEVYTAARAALLPTPSQAHYRFSFRDLHRVLQGVLSIAPASCGGNVPVALTRLWVHEVQRVFGDRLVCDADRAWLQQLQQELLVSKFGWQHAAAAASPSSASSSTSAQEPSSAGPSAASFFTAPSASKACTASAALFESADQVLLGDFGKLGLSRPERAYEELPGVDALAGLLERYLDEYNLSGGVAASAARTSAAAAAGAGGRRHSNIVAVQPVAASVDAGPAPAGSKGDGVRRAPPLQLVFFRDAVLHVVRLARILRQPRCA